MSNSSLLRFIKASQVISPSLLSIQCSRHDICMRLSW